MIKIGEFSKLSRVSIRMLRHYDDIGLLQPARIDEFSGYRYYEPKQLISIGKITSLKDMGFSLADISVLIDEDCDKEKLDAYYVRQQKMLTKTKEAVEYKLMLLDTARKRLREEHKMNFDFSVKMIPERYAACVEMVLPNYEAEGMAWGVLCEETDALKLVPADPEAIICLGTPFDEMDGNVISVDYLTSRKVAR